MAIFLRCRILATTYPPLTHGSGELFARPRASPYMPYLLHMQNTFDIDGELVETDLDAEIELLDSAGYSAPDGAHAPNTTAYDDIFGSPQPTAQPSLPTSPTLVNQAQTTTTSTTTSQQQQAPKAAVASATTQQESATTEAPRGFVPIQSQPSASRPGTVSKVNVKPASPTVRRLSLSNAAPSDKARASQHDITPTTLTATVETQTDDVPLFSAGGIAPPPENIRERLLSRSSIAPEHKSLTSRLADARKSVSRAFVPRSNKLVQ